MSVSTKEPKLTISDLSKPTYPAGLSSTLRFRAGLGLLAVLVAVSVVLAAGVGAVHVPSPEIVSMLLNRSGFVHLSQTWPQSDQTIIFQIRLPRVLAAALVGAALSVAGVLFQGLFRNPLADPYVIGTSGGAAFLVTADLLARVVMPPNEVPVGILTALVGGPAFLLLLRRTKREYRF